MSLSRLVDNNGKEYKYWIPAMVSKFPEYNPAGYLIEYFNTVLLPEWLEKRGLN